MRLGSSFEADQPQDGFEARLRARIVAEGAEGAEGAATTWADGIGLVARPALGVALLALLAALAWSGWQSTRPSADDFGLLAGADETLTLVLADGLDDGDSGATFPSPDAGGAP